MHLAALREAVTFLASQQRQPLMANTIAQALEYLLRGRTGLAQTVLRQHAEAAAAQGDTLAAAAAERRRTAVALLDGMPAALAAYRRVVDLDPHDWLG